MGELADKRILLGLTGGIAAYKAADLARALIKEGADVQVVMTEAACRFVSPLTLQALTGKPVFTSMWDERVGNGMPHIELSRDRDLIVVAPATVARRLPGLRGRSSTEAREHRSTRPPSRLRWGGCVR